MRALATLALSLPVLLAGAAPPESRPRESVERDGHVVRVLGPEGAADVQATPSRREAPAEKPCVVPPGATARESRQEAYTVDP